MNIHQKIYLFFAKRLCMLAWLSLVVLIISQLLGRYVWQLELLSHFIPYYAVVLILAGLVYPKSNHTDRKGTYSNLIRGLFVTIGMGLVIWCLPSYQMVKNWYTMPDNVKNKTTENQAFIAYQNINIGNAKKSETLTELTKHNPENIILLEAGGDWLPLLEPLKNNYPIHCGDDQFSPFAMHVFAKSDTAHCEFISLENVPSDIPLIKLTLSPKHSMYVIHPPPPISSELAKIRLAYLQGLHELIMQDRKQVLKSGSDVQINVIGDMNASQFSPVYRDFMKDTGLVATTSASTPTWLPFMIGIDHYLTTPATETDWHSEVDFVGWQGSDHRGFVVR